MQFTLMEKEGVCFVEGQPSQPFLRKIDDVSLVIEVCAENGVRSLLLYAQNLTERFFDLSSGEAGVVLQKLRTYGIRLAVVRDDGRRVSSQFGEMAMEERRGGQFGLFESAETARDWLGKNARRS
jgi:hypothetical protein